MQGHEGRAGAWGWGTGGSAGVVCRKGLRERGWSVGRVQGAGGTQSRGVGCRRGLMGGDWGSGGGSRPGAGVQSAGGVWGVGSGPVPLTSSGSGVAAVHSGAQAGSPPAPAPRRSQKQPACPAAAPGGGVGQATPPCAALTCGYDPRSSHWPWFPVPVNGSCGRGGGLRR